MPNLVGERLRQIVKEFEQRIKELEDGHRAEASSLNDRLKET